MEPFISEFVLKHNSIRTRVHKYIFCVIKCYVLCLGWIEQLIQLPVNFSSKVCWSCETTSRRDGAHLSIKPSCLLLNNKKIQQPLSCVKLNRCLTSSSVFWDLMWEIRREAWGPTKAWSGRDPHIKWKGGVSSLRGSKTIRQSSPRLGNVGILAWAPRYFCVFPSHCRCQYHARFPSSKSGNRKKDQMWKNKKKNEQKAL